MPLDQAIQLHDPQGAAASYVLLGAISEIQGNFNTAVQKYKKGLRSYQILDDVYWISMRIGLAHLKIREYTQAIQAFEKLLKGRARDRREDQDWMVACEYWNSPAGAGKIERSRNLFTAIPDAFYRGWDHHRRGVGILLRRSGCLGPR